MDGERRPIPREQREAIIEPPPMNIRSGETADPPHLEPGKMVPFEPPPERPPREA